MRTTERNRQRNIGIIAHVDAGKTTLTERVLFYTNAIHKVGGVDSGNTTTDSNPIEQSKGITIKAASVSCQWRDHAINLIDTPGHADFNIEVERSLRVLDGAVILLDGVAGVEPQTEKVWRQADRYGLPRICFINKLDRPGASFARSLQSFRERLGATPVVVGLPVGEETSTLGVIDLIRMRQVHFDGLQGEDVRYTEIPEEHLAVAAQYREALIEACADVDSGFLAKFLETSDVNEQDFLQAIRKGTRGGHFVPAFGGSALSNRGVQPLLDAVVDFLPAPQSEGNDTLVAFCFKVAFDRFGQLTFVRVYEGELRKGAQVASSAHNRKVRVGRIVRLFADDQHDVEVLRAGDIGAIVGGAYRTGETLSDPSVPVNLEPLLSPEPVVRLAIEPKTMEDRERLSAALVKMLAEDPSLELSTDPDTGQTILGGIGQLHLEVVVERLEREHQVRVNTGRPKVAFRESITTAVDFEHKHQKQTGGPGQFAHLKIRVAPGPRGSGIAFESQIRGGAISNEYISGVRKGIIEAAQSGVLGGYPVVDVNVTLLDGSQHSNDSSEMAFRLAAGHAFREAQKRADAVLLEPIVELQVVTSEEYLGSVIGDLSSRRGQITSMGQDSQLETTTTREVRGAVPLVEMFGYASSLNGMTHGRGQHSFSFARYAEVPSGLTKRLLEEA